MPQVEMITNTISQKDKDYMMNTERWFEQQSKILCDPEKFLAAYPNYKNIQVDQPPRYSTLLIDHSKDYSRTGSTYL